MNNMVRTAGLSLILACVGAYGCSEGATEGGQSGESSDGAPLGEVALPLPTMRIRINYFSDDSYSTKVGSYAMNCSGGNATVTGVQTGYTIGFMQECPSGSTYGCYQSSCDSSGGGCYQYCPIEHVFCVTC